MPYRVVDLIEECKHAGVERPFDNEILSVLGQYALGRELHAEGIHFDDGAIAKFQQELDAAVRTLLGAPLLVTKTVKGQLVTDLAARADRFARPTVLTAQLAVSMITCVARHAPIDTKGVRNGGRTTALRRHRRRVATSVKELLHRTEGEITASKEARSPCQDEVSTPSNSELGFGSMTSSTIKGAAASSKPGPIEVFGARRAIEEENAIAAFLSMYDNPIRRDAVYNIVPIAQRAYIGSGANIVELRSLIQTVMPSELSGVNAKLEFSATDQGSDFRPDNELLLIEPRLRDIERWPIIDASAAFGPPPLPQSEDRKKLYRDRDTLKKVARRIAETPNLPRSEILLGPAGIGKSSWLHHKIKVLCGGTVRGYFINFKSWDQVPSERQFEISALDKVFEQSRFESTKGLTCWAFIDECTQLTEADLVKLKYMQGFCMAGDERQSYAALWPGAYADFIKYMDGEVHRDGVSHRAENYKLASLMLYLFYGAFQPPLGIDKEHSMVQLHFCETSDRRVIAQRMYGHALKAYHSTILCDDRSMREIVQDLIENNKSTKPGLKVISSLELPGHQCYTLIIWINEHDYPRIGLNDALTKINLMLGRAAFRLSIVCSGPLQADRDHLFSTMLLAALSYTPSRPPIVEDIIYAAFDDWLSSNFGHNVRTELGHLVFVKNGKVVCAIVDTESKEPDLRALMAAASREHRRVIHASSVLLRDIEKEATWLELARLAGLIK